MNLLKPIAPSAYELGRDVCAEPEDIEKYIGALFMASFINFEEETAVEGLVKIENIDGGVISFTQSTDDGEIVGELYEPPINSDGVIGALTLKDDGDFNANEGYFKRHGDQLDDEFSDLLAELDPLVVKKEAEEEVKYATRKIQRSFDDDDLTYR